MANEQSQSVQILKTSALFKGFPDNEISKIGSHCIVKDLNAGETLFFEREESTALFIVSKGTVVIKKGSGGGDESVTNIGPQQHFGEMAFLMGDGALFEKRSAAAESGPEAAIILEVPYSALNTYFTSSPQMGLIFYKNLALSLAGRIRRTTDDLAGVRSLRLRHT